jgi:hypothetical protein
LTAVWAHALAVVNGITASLANRFVCSRLHFLNLVYELDMFSQLNFLKKVDKRLKQRREKGEKRELLARVLTAVHVVRERG